MAYVHNKQTLKTQADYEKDHVTRISLKLMNSTDADILDHLRNCESKQGEIKRLMRFAMEIERNKMEETKMENTELNDLVERINSSDTWDFDDLEKLCSMAGMEKEWSSADGETFESVAYAAAEKLGVEI